MSSDAKDDIVSNDLISDGFQCYETDSMCFQEFHANVSFCQLVTEIDFSDSSLERLPVSFCELCSLKVCRLSGNTIEDLPDGFERLQRLCVLRLDSNLLTYLPTYLEWMDQLDTLDVYDNEIYDAYCSLECFERLDVAQNFIPEPDTSEYDMQKKSLRNAFEVTFRHDGIKNADCENEIKDNVLNNDDDYWDPDDIWESSDAFGSKRHHWSVWHSIYNKELAQGRFCPADIHPEPVAKTYHSDDNEPGIFDDASEDES